MKKNNILGLISITILLFVTVIITVQLQKNVNENYHDVKLEEKQSKEQIEIKKLDIQVANNREDELVFLFSIDKFIDCFNSYYYEKYNKNFLIPASNWVSFTYDETSYSKFTTMYYRFQPDVTNYNEPTISVYVPENSEYIQEITLDFSEHNYTEYGLQMYREYCFYTLKALFSDFDDSQIKNIYYTLYHKAYDCYIDDENVPEPKVIYYKENIGLYPYFRLGVIHICIIPITLVYLNELESENVEIYKIDDIC